MTCNNDLNQQKNGNYSYMYKDQCNKHSFYCLTPKMTYEITVWLPDQWHQSRPGIQSNYQPPTVRKHGPILEFQKNSKHGGILYDIRACEGNSRNY